VVGLANRASIGPKIQQPSVQVLETQRMKTFSLIYTNLSLSLPFYLYSFYCFHSKKSHNKRRFRDFSLIGADDLAFPPPENQPNPLLGVAKIRMAGQRSSEMAGRGSTKSTETFSPLSSVSNSDTIVQSN